MTKLSDIPTGARLFNSRSVDEIKNAGTKLVLTQLPTIQRVSQRLVLCLTAIFPEHSFYLCDISQAYVQSATNLNREFYIRPPEELRTELGIQEGTILRVLKLFYGVPEEGNHWFKIYHRHYTENLGIEQSTYDPCLLQSNKPFGVVGLQTDDILFLADEDFTDRELSELRKAKFIAKELEKLTIDIPIKFNGGIIQLTTDGIVLIQER